MCLLLDLILDVLIVGLQLRSKITGHKILLVSYNTIVFVELS